MTQGCRNGTDGDRRYGVRGPQDNPDPHVARSFDPKRATPPFSRAGAAPGWEPAGDSITAPWGRDDSLGTDSISARGAMWGAEIGDVQGERSLGATARFGGLQKAIVAGPPDVGAPKRPPRIVHTALGTIGPLKASAILPVITARFPLLAGCFVTALERDSGSSPRVEVRFRIDPSGSAAGIRVSPTHAHSRPLESCVRTAFVGLSFPSSDAGATVVSYPLLRVR